VGRESYGYLVSAALWGTLAGGSACLVGLPSIFIEGGVTPTFWVSFGIVCGLVGLTYLRLYQSKQARSDPAGSTDE